MVSLLALLVALWGFTAWVTVRDGVNLLGVQALDVRVFDPTEPLLLQVQLERRASLVYLGRPDAARREELTQLRQRADELAAEFAESTDHWQVDLLGNDALHDRVAELEQRLAALPETRAGVDGRSIGRGAAGAAYTELIQSIYEVYDELRLVDDARVAGDAARLIRLSRARELLSQEDALLAGALAAGRITSAERAQFTRVVGARRFVAEQAVARLPEADQRRYEQMSAGASFRRLADLENRLMLGGNGARLPFTAAEWSDTTGPALIEIGDVILAGGDDLVERATPVAIGIVVRLVLVAGLGLLAVIAAMVVSVTTTRAVARQSQRLRDADVGREAAVRTAGEEAELRRAVREVFLNLARRTQALVHRQLTLLDSMQRREQDPAQLVELFRVDNLATRTRRNAENLIVLSGGTPARTWRDSVPMMDVVRGAVGEVEEYTRVTVVPIGGVSLAGRAVGDTIHLLAELIENGLSFSPHHTTVEVRGQLVANGFAIEIEDRGLGMTEEDRAAANHRMAERGEPNRAEASRLGLHVVSRLGDRHGVRVRLTESVYGGTSAVVLIPSALITVTGAEPGGTRADAPAPVDGPGRDAPAEAHLGVGADNAGLPTRSRRGPARSSALDAPTIPIGLPVTAEQDGPAVAGLPVRVRQANLAPGLRAEPEAGKEGDRVIREPERVRRMMSAYQTGTRRGRSEAARLLGGGDRSGQEDSDGADHQAT
ncbi:nitrate- and nitrite sensing domain-containing protein [Micromonospora sp. WMMD1082]|uniref:sensor histidine kinase n=1 Tax=Micromonospora sp. WMMD1082 TaxID=3016104 RepID=UPI002415A24B|nr:nitrate- and nitrite sensing domain-containing protein [Micromonospora sp. WMMD1082]MDG4796740.1 nitrate- and nitrite sensing domain-containing protein [Micromonospora sp. WMMD1082]